MPTPRHRPLGLWRRAAMRLAHAQPVVLIALIATDAARDLSDSPAVTLTFGGVMVVVVLAFVAEHYHEYRLCTRCAAATGGPDAAARRHRWLRLHHWATERVGYALIFLGAFLVTIRLGLPQWASYPVWALVAYANLIHRPVQPWCAHCRGWDDDEPDPAPPPVPAAGATR